MRNGKRWYMHKPRARASARLKKAVSNTTVKFSPQSKRPDSAVDYYVAAGALLLCTDAADYHCSADYHKERTIRSMFIPNA